MLGAAHNGNLGTELDQHLHGYLGASGLSGAISSLRLKS